MHAPALTYLLQLAIPSFVLLFAWGCSVCCMHSTLPLTIRSEECLLGTGLTCDEFKQELPHRSSRARVYSRRQNKATHRDTETEATMGLFLEREERSLLRACECVGVPLRHPFLSISRCPCLRVPVRSSGNFVRPWLTSLPLRNANLLSNCGWACACLCACLA